MQCDADEAADNGAYNKPSALFNSKSLHRPNLSDLKSNLRLIESEAFESSSYILAREISKYERLSICCLFCRWGRLLGVRVPLLAIKNILALGCIFELLESSRVAHAESLGRCLMFFFPD